MADLNTVTLTGRLTADAELRRTTSDLPVVRFTLAVDRAKKDETDFIRCIAWRQSAEYLADYAGKGYKIGVAGHIRTGSYDDKETGKKVYTTEVECERVTILESKKQKADYPSGGQSVYTKQAYTDADVDTNNDLPF